MTAVWLDAIESLIASQLNASQPSLIHRLDQERVLIAGMLDERDYDSPEKFRNLCGWVAEELDYAASGSLSVKAQGAVRMMDRSLQSQLQKQQDWLENRYKLVQERILEAELEPKSDPEAKSE